MMFHKFFRYVILASLCLTLSACFHRPMPNIGEKGKLYHIKNVKVSVAPDVDTGLIQMDGEPKEQLTDRTKQKVSELLNKEVKGTLSGDKPATLEVRLYRIDISSKPGRILLQSQSSLCGYVNLVDEKTKEIVAQHNIVTGEGRTRFEGNMGVLVGLAYNTAVNTVSDPVSRIADNFADDTKEWLLRKPE